MPKLGFKCFIGSFMLSLVAVFAVTKAYFVLSINEQEQKDELISTVPVKNIELFAASEENDPIYDKFNDINSHKGLPAPEGDETMVSDAQNSDSTESGILYQPESSETEQSEENIIADAGTQIHSADTDMNIEPALTENNTEEELQIADASDAPIFKIPLVHNYKTENGTIAYSESADESQIASASRDISFENLGADSSAALTEPLVNDDEIFSNSEFSAGLNNTQQEDNPWKVAEIANKHSAKNTLNSYEAKHQDSIVSPDQEIAEAPHEGYKMQENILIPIPESIRNERNLTPQFSTSEENLRLERELRAKRQLPALSEDSDTGTDTETGAGIGTDKDISILDEDTERDFDEEEIDEETSKSLTDSIAEWFSGSKKKTPQDNITAPDTKTPKAAETKKSSDNSSGSIFNKLLGIEKSNDENITPSELKLSFQPNRAEISGQTLEWLHAFADNSVKNEDVFVEIRIDKSAPYALQEKRLKLLYKILANNGVDYHKINIIFTDREPNSFIIRNVRYASEEDKVKAMKRADNPWY